MEEGQGAFDFARQFPLLARAERLRSERIHRRGSRGKRRGRGAEEKRDAEEEEGEGQGDAKDVEEEGKGDPEEREKRDAEKEDLKDPGGRDRSRAVGVEKEGAGCEGVAWAEESAVLSLQRWYRRLRRREVWRRWCERRRLRLRVVFQEWRWLTERHVRLREVLDPWLDGPPATAPLLSKLDPCVFDARAVYREMGRGRMAFLFHRLWLKLRMFCRWKERLMMRLFVPEEDGMS